MAFSSNLGACSVADSTVIVSVSIVISLPVATKAKSADAVIVSPSIVILSTVRAVKVPKE